MHPLLRLVDALIRPQMQLRKAYALRRFKYSTALAVLAGLAGGFTLALITTLLVVWVGLLWALAIEAGVFGLAAGVVYGVMRAEARRQARETAQLAEIQKQELRAALLAAMPKKTGFGLAAAGIAAALALLLAAGSGSGKQDDPDD